MLIVLDDFRHDFIRHIARTFFKVHLYSMAELWSLHERFLLMSYIALANMGLQVIKQ